MLINLHILFAFLSLSLLIIRAFMQLTHKDWRGVKLLKILPHISDTILLASGIYILSLWQFEVPLWLAGKFVLLILYIIFAAKFFSKKQAKNRPHFFILALSCFVGAMLLAYWH